VNVEELLEIEEIRNLRVLYSHFFDGCDLDGLVGLFTEDAVCEFGPAFGGDWVGRDVIRANYAQQYERTAGVDHSFLHVVTNPWVELLAADRARGRCYLLDISTSVPAGSNPLRLLGIYVDSYRKLDRRWYIDRTRIDFLWPDRSVAAGR
jgi:hypothetical protein